MSRAWRVRLTRQAESDFLEISRWTTETFGARQSALYAETLTLAIEALHAGPDVVGAKTRDEIAPGIRTLHVARKGRKGRHFVVFRASEGQTVDVLRFLHDSMDLEGHVSTTGDERH